MLRRWGTALALALALTGALGGAAYADAPGEQPPPGANDWSCKPTAAHPEPVVLVHGFGAWAVGNWSFMSPLIKNAGYCVFSLTYGRDPRFGPYSSGGIVKMEDSAPELAAFVTRVKNATGASKVDIVGHSEGTVMPRWYMQKLGGAGNVAKFVTLAALWNGTTLNGFSAYLHLSDVWCGACSEVAAGSDFMNSINAEGQTIPGVTITNIASRYDELVTPYTSGFSPGATNITLQDVCAADVSEHVALAFDPIVEHLILNALDPVHATPAGCTG